MTRHIFLQYEKPEASPALLFFIGVCLALSAMAIVFCAGFETRDWLQRQHDKQVQEAEKMKPRPAAKPVFLIGCDRPAVEEVARTCRHRRASALVGAK